MRIITEKAFQTKEKMYLHLQSLYPISIENTYKIKNVSGYFLNNTHLNVTYQHKWETISFFVSYVGTTWLSAAKGKINPA